MVEKSLRTWRENNKGRQCEYLESVLFRFMIKNDLLFDALKREVRIKIYRDVKFVDPEKIG